MKKFRLASASAVVLFLGVQVAQAESLSGALLEAYRKNPTLNAARAGQRATDENVPQALSGWRPTVSATGVVAQNWQNNASFLTNTPAPSVLNPNPASSFNSYTNPTTENLTIRLNQPIFRGFKTVESTKVAEAQVKAGQQQLLVTEQTVLLNGVQSYLDVIRDRKTLQLRQQNLTVLAEQLRASDARFKAGELTRTDVAQSRAGLETARAALSSAVAQLRSSEATFEQIIGHKPGRLESVPAARPPSSLGQAFEIAHETNPQILAAAQNIDAAEHNVGVARSGLLPIADLTGIYNFAANQNTLSGTTPISTNTSALTVQGSVQVPIYEAGFSYSQVRQAKQRASQSRISIIDTTRQVRQAVATSWETYIASKQGVSSIASSVSASQIAYDGVRQEYAVGSRSTIDVLNAEQTLLNAQISQVSLQHDLILASYRLQASIGHLTGRHLHLGPVYDPNENYLKVRGKWIGTKADVLQ